MEDKPEMVELSVQMSDLMNYDIKIPKIISANNFSEILKRLKVVKSMLPKEAATIILKKGTSPVLQLKLGESEKLYDLYKQSTPESFAELLKTKYTIDKERAGIISLMNRLYKRIYNLKARAPVDV